MPLHLQGGGAEPRWGEASSEESEGEAAHYIGRRREVLDAGGTVLADAAPEFGSLAAVKGRLEAWKRAHPGVGLETALLSPNCNPESPKSLTLNTEH